MKAANHRSQYLTASSVGLASQETPIPEQIYCPLICGTLPRTSCEARQNNPDTHRECRTDHNGNCRAKRVAPQRQSDEAREKMARHAAYKTRAAEERAETIVKKFDNGQGQTVDQIAEDLGCCRELIYRRLREAGIYQQPGGPIRKQVFDWLDKNPDADYKQVHKKFGCHRSTASSYCTQYRQTVRYKAALLRKKGV